MFIGLLDRLISSFSIGRLVIASFLARLVTLYLLPSSPSFLAPDEGTYASLASWVAESRDVEEFPAFGPNLYNTSKTLILPAAALVKFGLDELTAVRIVSILFGTLSIYLFAMIIFLILGIRQLQDLKELNSQRIAFIGICSFAFMPSSFIWSTLGLRESASKAMALASVLLLIRLRNSENWKGKFKQLKVMLLIWILGVLAISLSFGARPQTAIVFVVSLGFFLILMSKRRHSFSMAWMLLTGTVIGLLFSTTPKTQATSELFWTPVGQAASVAGKPASLNVCNQIGSRLKIDSQEFLCMPKTATKKQITLTSVVTQAPIKNLDELETQREANRVGAQTALAETNCTAFTNISLQNLKCNLAELPYRLSSILFRPLPFIDSGSFANNLASAENLIWIFLISIFAYSFIISIRKRVNLYITIPTTAFVIVFATLSALYEGNLGTAFRHKSTILWGLILVVTVVLTSNKTHPEKAGQEN